MTAATVPAIYASALIDHAEELGQAEAILAAVAEVGAILAANPELIQGVEGSELSREQSKSLLRSIFTGRIPQALLDFLTLLVDRDRFTHVRAICAEALTQYTQRQGIVEVTVVSAAALTEATQSKLEATVARLMNQQGSPRQPRYTYTLDPAIIGGLQIRYGDTLVDASLQRLLTDINHLIRHLPLKGMQIENDGTREIRR